MKDEFSLETLKGKIHSANTSEYFEEVYSSYVHGNYRSAVVMLWSVVILDLIQKLQTLEDAYEDVVATNILHKINELKKDNSRTSSWELELVREICERTDLIDFNEYKTIEYLQQQRHLSAHPVLDGLTKLYTPNKDTTRALIRNSLEIIFVKPPVYTKKVLHSLLLDLEENRDAFPDMKELKKYVTHKYLERMTLESRLKIFETIWKFVMHSEDAKCKKNRFINLRFLIILARKDTKEIEKKIRGRADFYSKIKNEPAFTNLLVIFLSRIPSIYKILNLETQIIIDKAISSSINNEVIGYFNKKSMQEHYDNLEKVLTSRRTDEHIPANLWKILGEASNSREMDKAFTDIISLCYNQSMSFDSADDAYSTILQFMDKFDKEAFENLLESSEANRQTYKRTRAYEDYARTKEKILELDNQFDFERYPRFKSALTHA